MSPSGQAGPQRAKYAETPPPAMEKLPPTNNSPLRVVRALTNGLSAVRCSNPLPRACHWAPSQRAMWFALTPPALAKEPAAMSSPSYTVSALTNEFVPVIPDPSGCQIEPFHRAIRFALTPPAVVNDPPAI